MFKLLYKTILVPKAVLNAEHISALDDASVCLFLEFLSQAGFKRIADFVFAADKRVASRRVICRPLDQYAIPMHDDGCDPDTRYLA